MKKIIKLTESDLETIVKRVINEQNYGLPNFSTNLGGIKSIQQALINKGYSVGKEEVDGVLGPNTKRAIINYQRANGIKPTGNVGPITAKSLNVQQLTSQTKTTKPSSNLTSKKVTPIKTTQTTISGKFSEQVRRQLQYMKNNNLLSNEKFTIVDDKNNQVHAFENGYKLVKTFYVITGKDKGDELKTQSMIDFAINPTNWPKISKAFKSNDKNDVATSIKKCYFNNWKTMNTPSGVFRRAGVLQNAINDLLLTGLLESVYGKQYVTWETCDGNTIPFGFHGTQSEDRVNALNADVSSKKSCKNRDMSFGCINFKDQDVPVMNKFIEAGQLSIWLSDETNDIVKIPQNCISGSFGKIWNKI